MKTIKLMFALSILTVSFTACKKEKIFGIKGEGDVESQVRQVSGFDKIELDIDAEVEYYQDSVYYVEVQAQSNLFYNLHTEVNNDGSLEIYFKNWVRSHKSVKVIVHSPNMTAFKINGSGNIKSLHLLNTNSMETEISGSGNISFENLVANSLDSEISGSGDLSILGGNVSIQEIEISGSGKIKNSALISAKSIIEISGSGDVEVNCTDAMDVEISGSGTVYYLGNPIITLNISGSGDLIHL